MCVVKTQRKAKQAETLTQDYIITRKLLAPSPALTPLLLAALKLRNRTWPPVEASLCSVCCVRRD